MAIIDMVAKEFHMSPNELLNESLKAYLGRKLSRIETDIFVLAKKYGVKDVFDLDTKIREGLISEEESYDDYFALDNLEAERDKIVRFIENI